MLSPNHSDLLQDSSTTTRTSSSSASITSTNIGKRTRECHHHSLVHSFSLGIQNFNNDERIEQEIEEFKVDHRTKALNLFRKSLSKHQALIQKQQRSMEEYSEHFLNHQNNSLTNTPTLKQEQVTLSQKQEGKLHVKKEIGISNVSPCKNILAVTVFSSDLFKLNYTHFEYLKSNRMATEQAAVTFLPYKDDDFSVDYGKYEQFFDDLSFIENQNNLDKKSEYNQYSRYYLDLMAETVYRSMADKMFDTFGDDETVWYKMVQDFVNEYENEYGSLFRHMHEEHVNSERKHLSLQMLIMLNNHISNYSIFKREREQKTQQCNGSLEAMWTATAKSLCFKCMKFDCPIHILEYKTCARDSNDARVVLKFNDEEIIERILDKLFKKQQELIEAKQILLTPCCGENKCHVHYYYMQQSSIQEASYDDWTEIDKELALNTIYIYGEKILEILKGSQLSLHKNVRQQPIRDVFCEIARHHRKPCCEIAQFLKDWFYKNSLLKRHVSEPIHGVSLSLEKLPTLRRLAPSFLTSQEQTLLKTPIPKRVDEKTVKNNSNQPDIYNPCQCALLNNVSECTCVKNRTFCTELCHCFTTINRFDQIYKNKPCPGGDKCFCKLFSRTCSDSCGSQCHPYKFTKKFLKKCAVGLSQIDGLGVFALEGIEKDSLIMEYVGELVSYEELHRRDIFCKVFQSCYVFDLKKGIGVDAYRKGNESRFVNDAQGPVKAKTAKNNCTPKVVFDSEVHDYRIGIFALETIKAGSELLFSYGDNFWDPMLNSDDEDGSFE
ncbi:hypothetical protein C9374_004679 [Naegleria lovaniensis]|uniref:SET domain-containing protein n=1 Tax=Naegleria lovaniensis TaxID=51637 RepID=A0AA88KJL1_NAELO|nr:uncharacterized protein C9374_004679 [Naegleria lovaniensis]KAG2383342.1 hypothetical protein C9374_004679 [Naegleria lovaniensis]